MAKCKRDRPRDRRSFHNEQNDETKSNYDMKNVRTDLAQRVQQRLHLLLMGVTLPDQPQPHLCACALFGVFSGLTGWSRDAPPPFK